MASRPRARQSFWTVSRADIATVHDQLADAGADDWEGFTAVFTPPVPFEVPDQIVNPYRFTAKLSYHGKPFSSVPVEVSAVEAGNADHYDKVTSDALALVGLPVSDAVPCMTLPWQVAQKIHACTEPIDPPRRNDRAAERLPRRLPVPVIPRARSGSSPRPPIWWRTTGYHSVSMADIGAAAGMRRPRRRLSPAPGHPAAVRGRAVRGRPSRWRLRPAHRRRFTPRAGPPRRRPGPPPPTSGTASRA